MGVKVFPLPDPGEGLTEAEIVTWLVAAGDTVTVNQIVVEIETAKSLVELPIPWAGTVAELLVAEGQTVPVGTPIISVEVAGADSDAPAGGEPREAAVASGTAGVASPSAGGAPGGAPQREPNLVGYGAIAGSTKRRPRKGGVVPAPAGGTSTSGGTSVAGAAPQPAGDRAAVGQRTGRPLVKPPVRMYAKDHCVDLTEVTGTGERGVITRADIDAFLARGAAAGPAPVGSGTSAGSGSSATPDVPLTTSSLGAMAPNGQVTNGPRETRIPVKGVRKLTAEAMVRSAFTAPHVTEFVTVDVTATMDLVDRLRDDREFRDVKVTPLLVVAKALLLACRRNPEVNAVWDEAAEEIVVRNYVHLGIAAATPRGLVVPNIKDADAMSMRDLADALSGLVETARSGRTQPAEMAGGTITITNVGVFGIDTGTPIINPGESAILAFGAVRRMPWVVTGGDGRETVVPRWVTQLALSFDHRLIDGDLGSRFLADIAAILADPARVLVWG